MEGYHWRRKGGVPAPLKASALPFLPFSLSLILKPIKMAKKDFKDKKSPQYLKFLIRYYFPAGKNKALLVKPEKLNQLIKESAQKATQNYQKLSSPKTCDLLTYINYWTQQAVITELAKKTLIKMSPKVTFRRDD